MATQPKLTTKNAKQQIDNTYAQQVAQIGKRYSYAFTYKFPYGTGTLHHYPFLDGGITLRFDKDGCCSQVAITGREATLLAQAELGTDSLPDNSLGSLRKTALMQKNFMLRYRSKPDAAFI